MVFVFLVTFSLFFSAAASCSNGWVRYDDSCYLFEHIQKEPWHVASNYCTTLDAELVRIETQSENNFLKTEIQKLHSGSDGQFWTAGNDIQTETEWIWAGNNEHITGYTNWAPGEPNQINGEEDCLTIYPRKGYHWNDAQCDKSMNYVCEHFDRRSLKIENENSMKTLTTEAAYIRLENLEIIL